MNPAIDEIIPQKPDLGFEVYYDVIRKEYLVPDAHLDWVAHSESQMKRLLKFHGFSSIPPTRGAITEIEREMIRLMSEKGVSYVGPLAGYQKGFYDCPPHRLLVTTSPKIIMAVEGAFPTLEALMIGLLGQGVQLYVFYAWVKISYAALKSGTIRPGQVLFFIGPREGGKSLLQNLLTLMFGGRAARPYQFMTGGTTFNADIFGAEHLIIEDENPATDIRSRRAFGSQLKTLTVNETQRLHAKHKDAITLKPFWRISVSLNDEPENVMVLPPIDDSIADKVLLFKTERNPMPMRTVTTAEREAFWNTLVGELPGFLHFLENWEIPENMLCPRFGVRAYHHPDILNMLDDLAPEIRLLNLIDHQMAVCIPFDKHEDRWELTAEQLEAILTDHAAPFSHEARKLLSWPAACGTYLGRIAKKFPERVQKHRTAESRKWVIISPKNTEKEGK